MNKLKDKIYKAKEIGGFYLGKHIELSKTPEPNHFFFDKLVSEQSVIKRLLLEYIDEKLVVQDADRICSGELRLYSLDPKIFRDGINWHKDYYSNHEWPLKPFNRIYDPNNSRIDLNVPFELSRLQFVPTLIQAYELTSNQRYLQYLQDIVDLWIDGNPYCFGVNWWSCMEVGLRAVNLVLAIGWISQKKQKLDTGKYLKVLWKHALYIYKYDVKLDRVKNKNNHFLGAMLGLLSVSFCFEGKEAENYRDYSMHAFKREICRQFNEDGGNFESATGYHQYSLEVVLVMILFNRVYHNNETSEGFIEKLLGNGVRKTLIKALNLVCDYMSCYGESPHIGDSSDCRVLVYKDYFNRKPYDHSFLFGLGKVAINYETPTRQNDFISIYPESGYAFFRNKKYGLVAFAGPKGTNGSGGHGHNDKCSFVLQVMGELFLVDSGTYIYNPNIYDRFGFKKGKAHNIVMVDDKEQCDIIPERVFGLIGTITPRVKLKKDVSLATISMTHDGYDKYEDMGVYCREIACFDNRIEITDFVNGTGSHEILFIFNLSSSINYSFSQNQLELIGTQSKLLIIFPSFFEINIEESFLSKTYHDRMKNKRIVGKCYKELPIVLKTKIIML